MCKTNVQYINSREIRFRSSHQRCSIKKVFLEISQISQENTCARVSFLIKLRASGNLINLFSCEFCEISKSTFFSVDTRRGFKSIRRLYDVGDVVYVLQTLKRRQVSTGFIEHLWRTASIDLICSFVEIVTMVTSVHQFMTSHKIFSTIHFLYKFYCSQASFERNNRYVQIDKCI